MAIYFEGNFTEFKVLGQFDIHERTSMNYWQVTTVYDDDCKQLMDVHDFLIESEGLGLCIYTGTELHVFVTRMIEFMDKHGIMSDYDLEDFQGQLWDDMNPEYIRQILSEIITYDIEPYCSGLCSNETHGFGPNPNGGCLGYWEVEEEF